MGAKQNNLHNKLAMGKRTGFYMQHATISIQPLHYHDNEINTKRYMNMIIIQIATLPLKVKRYSIYLMKI